MTRKRQREQAFEIIFEKSFRDDQVEEIIECAGLTREFEITEFTRELIFGVNEHAETLDELIERCIKGWKIGRLSKVSLAALRLAVYEMRFMQDIPLSVSINEAVEICKKYGGEEDAPYINGVLGSVAKLLEPENPEGE